MANIMDVLTLWFLVAIVVGGLMFILLPTGKGKSGGH